MDIIDPMRIVFWQRAIQAPTQKNAPASRNLYEGPTILWFHGLCYNLMCDITEDISQSEVATCVFIREVLMV